MSAELIPSEADKDNEWLPDYCPPWCEGGHAVAVTEGCTWTEAQEHRGGGYGDVLHELRNPIDLRVTRPGGAGWDLSIRQRPNGPDGLSKCDEPRVVLEASEAGFSRKADLHLTSGEARVLAAQLVALADRLDMPKYKRRKR